MPDELKAMNVDQDGSGSRVTIGMHVAITIGNKSETSERLEFDVVPDNQSDFSSGLISERAPLAQALLGHVRGETVKYVPPSGADQIVTILNVEPSQREILPITDRANSLGQLKDKIARRESRQIALTTELHYGSIDPDGIEE
jgi:Transcription elongation factor, GreA/GreB, C-term